MTTDQRGQSLVESAMSIGLLLLIVLAIADFGRVMAINTALSSGAQQGARTGVITENSGLITQSALGSLILVNTDDVSVDIDQTASYTQVTLTYTFSPLTPMLSVFVGESGVTLERSARIAKLGQVVP